MHDTLATLDVVARWAHVLGILVWMGHNLSNVVQTPVYRPVVPGEQAQARFDAAMRREHATFRYASVVTLVTGVYMLWYRGALADALTFSAPYAVLGVGVWTGLVMVANLWLVLWPHQRRVLGFVPAPEAERIRCSRITFLSSRTNTILLFPTLFFMIAGAHGLAFLQ
ncbi:urate hydroxylase PuuD [Arhodomonas sp. AD133]|uniref:urate hydroxylase PuuD n=1 Tax=Arhodomonas sp. AD133 TaxID=3415009 RepID=UPI003EB8B701